MVDIWMRYVEDLIDRVSGPTRFRLVLQPLMTAFFAIRSGPEDARAGKPPYTPVELKCRDLARYHE